MSTNIKKHKPAEIVITKPVSSKGVASFSLLTNGTGVYILSGGKLIGVKNVS